MVGTNVVFANIAGAHTGMAEFCVGVRALVALAFVTAVGATWPIAILARPGVKAGGTGWRFAARCLDDLATIIKTFEANRQIAIRVLALVHVFFEQISTIARPTRNRLGSHPIDRKFLKNSTLTKIHTPYRVTMKRV